MATGNRQMLAHRAVVYFDDSDGQRKIFGMLDSLEVKVNVNYVDYTKVGSNAKHRAAIDIRDFFRYRCVYRH